MAEESRTTQGHWLPQLLMTEIKSWKFLTVLVGVAFTAITIARILEFEAHVVDEQLLATDAELWMSPTTSTVPSKAQGRQSH